MYEYSVDKKLKSININGLLNLNKVFIKMIQPDIVMEAFKKLMGERFFCMVCSTMFITSIERTKSSFRLSCKYKSSR